MAGQESKPNEQAIPADLPGAKAVAFVDILGFRDLVRRIVDNGDVELYRRVFKALRTIAGHARLTSKGILNMPQARATAFSDSIVISDEAHEIGAASVIAKASLLSSWLLRDGIPCRGGVATGATYHDEQIIFGQGMINAYDLESRSAIYPRIVLANDLVAHAQESLLFRLDQDDDGFWYVDPFFHLQKARKLDPKTWIQDLFAPPEADPEQFTRVRGHIIGILQQLGEGADQRVLDKYHWLVKKFNRALQVYLHGEVEAITL